MKSTFSFLLSISTVCVILLFTDQVKSQALRKCPSGWSPYATMRNTTCVWLSHEQATWMEAMSWCKLMNGQLVEIGSPTFNGVITRMLIGQKPGKYWIGLTDMEVDSTYTWMTSKEPMTSFWLFKQGQARSGPQKNCVCTDEKGQWLVEPCKTPAFFICQKSSQ